MNMMSFARWIFFCLIAFSEGLQPDLPVKQCQDEYSLVTLTSTRLQVITVFPTITLLDVSPTYVSITTTDCVPYTVTHTETVSQYRAPQLAYSTHYVTELKIKEKNRAYTSTSYQPETISITYSATDVEEHVTQVVGTTTSTSVSTVSVVKTVSTAIATTVTYTEVDVVNSFTYLPVYITTTMTNAWPILKTVYQTEYVKEAVDYVTTVIDTSTHGFSCSINSYTHSMNSHTLIMHHLLIEKESSFTLYEKNNESMTALTIFKKAKEYGRFTYKIKSLRHNHSSSLKLLDTTISMSLNMMSFVRCVFFCLLASSEGLQPDLPVKQCQDEYSLVTLTSTRLQVNTVFPTITLLDVSPTYVSITTTDCVPYTVTHTETVSQYRAPQLAYSTHYVTELKIKEKNRAYTSTSYQPETISITYSATDVEEHVTQVVGTTTSTSVSTVSVVKTVSTAFTTTTTYTQVDVARSFTYLPVYVTTTMTNAWPILKTVYQTEYVKEAVDYVTTVIDTSTNSHSHRMNFHAHRMNSHTQHNFAYSV
ncbi:uncharacterized protein LOC122250346 [Penaeus japonicus]|uniref:uncharacterized protein LOC122250346 n=1 Tax=Penaeus japonicus TaxID=27405 RepID=UPI001C71004A|nr:uncharacterized protein LOC122250346 [Penaeus japonicus]